MKKEIKTKRQRKIGINKRRVKEERQRLMYFIWFRSLRALSNAVLVSKSCLSVSSSLRERRGEGRETKEEREEKERREWKLKNTRVCISSFLPLLTYISPLKSEKENSCTRTCIHLHVNRTAGNFGGS